MHLSGCAKALARLRLVVEAAVVVAAAFLPGGIHATNTGEWDLQDITLLWKLFEDPLAKSILHMMEIL